MSEQAARRRCENDLATLTLLEHLLAGGASHQPGLIDVGIHDIEKIIDFLIDNLRNLVEPRRDNKNVDTAELVDSRLHDLVAVCLRARPQGDDLGLAPELFAFARD